MAQNEKEARTTVRGQYSFKWSREQTEAFIRLRVQYQHLFTGARDTASSGYGMILDKMGIGDRVTPTQAKKKWDNLKTKYKECKCPASGTEDGKPTAAPWPLFTVMEEALGNSATLSAPCQNTLIQENKPGPSVAQVLQRGRDDDDEEEEDGESDKERRERRGQIGGKKRKREREDPFLTLLKEDLRYQREADERRAAEARERSNRFFALLERLVEK